MKEIAEELGYEYSYKGCICNGSPLYYRKVISGKSHQLVIYRGRGLWRLLLAGDIVLKGDSDNMNQLLNDYEISQSN